MSARHREQMLPLRSTLFSDYPYLYRGSAERDNRVFDALSHGSTILSLAYDNDQLVGAVIAIAVDDTTHRILEQHDAFQPHRGLMIDMVMVVISHHRKGIAREMLRLLEIEAAAQGYTALYGLTVVRSANHPLKPKRFIDIDEVWSRMGGIRTGITEVINWPTQCGTPGNEVVAPIDNMIQYWYKPVIG